MGAAGVATAARVTSTCDCGGSDGSEEREVVDILLSGWPVPFAARGNACAERKRPHHSPCETRKGWPRRERWTGKLEVGDQGKIGEGFFSGTSAVREFFLAPTFFIFWERS